MQKRNKGITLIALIITIIVLLILAGIVISLTIGENGIINRAKVAGITYDEQQAREKLELVLLDLQADKITNLDYNQNEYIDNRIIKNGMDIVADIAYVDGWAFSIDRSVPCIKEALGQNNEMVNSYIQDGLIVWYDGENNTGSGHSDTVTTWEDLSGNNNDAQLMNINHTETSGWSSNSLNLDGIDDWVKMMELNYPEITIEIVVKNKSVTPGKQQSYIANVQSGGYGIQKDITGQNKGTVYIDTAYDIVHGEYAQLEKMYSLSYGYTSNEEFFRDNASIQRKDIAGTLGYPEENTVFAIGANPRGNIIDNPTSNKYSNIEVYSVRIYNKYLSEDEINHNYNIDKRKYKIDEEVSTLGYTTDGLVVLYDGENNMGYGHSNTTSTWRNIAGGLNNGTLMNFNNIETSGWTSNSLKLDGINDWVKMSYLHYPNMTIEIVLKNTNIVNEKFQTYLANYQSGGTGIGKTTDDNIFGQVYVGSQYSTISKNAPEIGKSYSLSTGYNGGVHYFRENEIFYRETKTGIYKAPNESTIFAIGGNPGGNNISHGTNAAYSNIEVYSVRIYNRCLLENEIMQNYEVDKTRFNVE